MDAFQGPHIGVDGGPLCEAAVLSSLQQVLAPAVVGPLVEDPGAVLHLGRVDLAEGPVLGQVAHIFSEIQHLTTEVRTLVDTNPEHIRDLQDKDQLGSARGRSAAEIYKKNLD